MIKAEKALKIASFSILLIAVNSVVAQSAFKTINTTFLWIVETFIFYIYFLLKKYFFNSEEEQDMAVVNWYLAWNIFSIARGFFIAETYWDFKLLFQNLFILLMPVIAYNMSNPVVLQATMAFYVKYVLPLFFIVFFFIGKDAYGFYLVPVSFLIFFIPVLTPKWRWITLFFTLIVLLADLGARSNVIKFVVPVLLLSLYWLRFIIPIKLVELFRKALFIAPIILFYLAFNNIFNLLKWMNMLRVIT